MGATQGGDWLVVGLGNPGTEYAQTRHSVGFQVVDRLAAEAGVHFRLSRFQAQAARAEISGTPTFLLKPQAFMNRSGRSVAAWLEAVGLPPVRLVVVHDELDLPLGRLRVVRSAGPGGHRGVASVQESLATRNFPRVRVGIGRPREGQAAADRVLGEFEPEELPLVAEMVERAAAAVRTLIRDGLTSAMNRYNLRVQVSGG